MIRTFKEPASNQTADLRVDEEFQIVLPENPTTGYRWHIPDRVPPIVVLLEHHFERSSGLLGAGGTHEWKFRAVKPGTGVIEMFYARSFEKGKIAQQFRLQIRITA